MPRAVFVPTPRGATWPTLGTALLGSIVAAGATLGAALPARALTINTTYASSVAASPYAAQIQSAFNAAAGAFQSSFVNPVTVNIQVGWGEILGSPVSSLGVAAMYGYGSYSYSQMQTMLRATSTSTSDQTAYGRLPTANPAGALTYTLTPALAKGLGVAPANGTGIDGYIGFGGNYSFDFNRADGIAGGAYDFVGVAMHEISHVLGRVSGLTASPVNALPLDAFRYAAPGSPSFNYSAATYFSIDGGTTNLANFATDGERDSWAYTPGDAYSFAAGSGMVNDLSTADRILMDVLGWNTVAGTTTPVYGTTTTTTTTDGGGSGKTRPSKRRMLGDIDIDAGYDSLAFADSTDVPEPASMALLGAALLGLGVAARRRASA